MSNYPDNFNNAAFEARWGDAPEYNYPDPDELLKWCETQADALAFVAKANFIKAFGDGTDFDLTEASICLETALSEIIHEVYVSTVQERSE